MLLLLLLLGRSRVQSKTAENGRASTQERKNPHAIARDQPDALPRDLRSR